MDKAGSSNSRLKLCFKQRMWPSQILSELSLERELAEKRDVDGGLSQNESCLIASTGCAGRKLRTAGVSGNLEGFIVVIRPQGDRL